jgi:hypothetical protein
MSFEPMDYRPAALLLAAALAAAGCRQAAQEASHQASQTVSKAAARKAAAAADDRAARQLARALARPAAAERKAAVPLAARSLRAAPARAAESAEPGLAAKLGKEGLGELVKGPLKDSAEEQLEADWAALFLGHERLKGPEIAPAPVVTPLDPETDNAFANALKTALEPETRSQEPKPPNDPR